MVTTILKDKRIEKGFSQKELSEKSGVPQQVISTIESGFVKNPRIDTLIKLCTALDVKIEEATKDFQTEQGGVKNERQGKACMGVHV